MNFAPRHLADDELEFWRDARSFFEEHVTEEVLEREHREGGGFDEGLHLALGQRGWVAPRWPAEEGGAELDPLRARLVAMELARSGAPSILAGTTLLPPVAIRMFAAPDLRDEVLRGVADGTIRICLGYTEPDCGSDLAAVRTRAVRDGDEWVVNGQKMFTTGAQFSQYCFCLTRTNPDAPKHKGLTVFLIPLDLDGVEVRGISTLGGERTNFVHFDDVRVPDRYRLGEVNEGWKVVSAPLAQEHGMGDDGGATGIGYSRVAERLLAAVVEHLASAEQGAAPSLDDPLVRARLARVALHLEVAASVPGAMRRIVSSDLLLRDVADLVELLGPSALLERGADGAVVRGLAEESYRFAPGTAIYGGSTDIHRNLLAEQVMGLPRSTPRG